MKACLCPPQIVAAAEHTESLQIKDLADKMLDCYQRCKWGSQVPAVNSLLTALFISFSFGACFSWTVSCLCSELQSQVCETPKGQGIVGSFCSERLNDKEEKIKVSVFHLERRGKCLDWMVSSSPQVTDLYALVQNLARKLPGNRMALLSEAMNIKQWQIGYSDIEARGQLNQK